MAHMVALGGGGDAGDERVVMVEEDQTIAEVGLWVQMLEQAAEIHAALPDVMRERVDSQAMEAELMALTIYLASLSTRTRASFMRTCRDSLDRLNATRLSGPDADVVDFPQKQAL
jgi:hypothetical protein